MRAHLSSSSNSVKIEHSRTDSTVSDMSTQFDRKYPPDLYGQEASDNARVWQVYCDESGEHDMAMLEGWNKTLDILLIFVCPSYFPGAALLNLCSGWLVLGSIDCIHH